MNSYEEVYQGCGYSKHAEIAAFTKLNLKKKSIVDLVVIRTTKDYILRNSKPCFKCIELLNRFCKIKKIKIRNIYYSTETGSIIQIKFSQLENDHCTKHFRKNK